MHYNNLPLGLGPDPNRWGQEGWALYRHYNPGKASENLYDSVWVYEIHTILDQRDACETCAAKNLVCSRPLVGGGSCACCEGSKRKCSNKPTGGERSGERSGSGSARPNSKQKRGASAAHSRYMASVEEECTRRQAAREQNPMLPRAEFSWIKVRVKFNLPPFKDDPDWVPQASGPSTPSSSGDGDGKGKDKRKRKEVSPDHSVTTDDEHDEHDASHERKRVRAGTTDSQGEEGEGDYGSQHSDTGDDEEEHPRTTKDLLRQMEMADAGTSCGGHARGSLTKRHM